MSDKPEPGNAMGDIIGSARQRLEQTDSDPSARLKNLVAGTVIKAPKSEVREATATLPQNYFAQIPQQTAEPVYISAKKKPVRGPTRSLHVSFRLSPPERDRFIHWCEERNLSLPDGLMALLDLYEGKVGKAG